jgi:hypothetical protein
VLLDRGRGGGTGQGITVPKTARRGLDSLVMLVYWTRRTSIRSCVPGPARYWAAFNWRTRVGANRPFLSFSAFFLSVFSNGRMGTCDLHEHLAPRFRCGAAGGGPAAPAPRPRPSLKRLASPSSMQCLASVPRPLLSFMASATPRWWPSSLARPTRRRVSVSFLLCLLLKFVHFSWLLYL